MSEKDHIYEIEIKSLLSEEQYDSLVNKLPKIMNLLNKESLHTQKFKSNDNDIRLRHSKDKFELVHKEGFATDLTRKELTINLESRNEIDNFAKLLKSLSFTEEPSWITHRMDFEHMYDDHTYLISLQHTENFAKILEVEFIANNKDHIQFHEDKIKKIISELGCEPIEPNKFKNKISEYIKKNQNS